MNRNDITQNLLKERLVAIVRLKQQHDVQPTINALIKGGVKVLEITSNTPGYLEELATSRKQNPDIIIGTGTVTNTEIAKLSIKAGAQFLVTPNTNTDIIKLAHLHNIPVLMGALTPTEISNATENGADIIKLFPAGDLGINYFKSIKGPFSNIHFFAVGGIGIHNVKEWLESGAKGVGIGGFMVIPVHSKKDELIVIEKTNQLIRIIKSI